MITEEEIKKIDTILKKAGVKEWYLFGSRALDKENEFSDYDIGIKGIPKENKKISLILDLQHALGADVDIVDFDVKVKFYNLLKEIGELKRYG